MLEDLGSILECFVVLEETEADVVLTDELVALTVERRHRNGGQLLLLAQVSNKLVITRAFSVRHELTRKRRDIREHEVAALWHNRRQASTNQQRCKCVTLWLEFALDRLVIRVRRAETRQLTLEATRNHLLEERGTAVNVVLVRHLAQLDELFGSVGPAQFDTRRAERLTS